LQVPVYLIGRSVASILVACFSVLITLGFGIIFLKMPIALAEVKWGLFAAAFVLGMAVIICLGLMLGRWTLIIKYNAWSREKALGRVCLSSPERFSRLAYCPCRCNGWAAPSDQLLAYLDPQSPGAGNWQSLPMYTNLSDRSSS
jgi:hypothetical protein